MRHVSVRKHLRRIRHGVSSVVHHERGIRSVDHSESDALKRIPLRSNVLPVQIKIIVPSTKNQDRKSVV